MSHTDLKSDLLSLTPSVFASRWIFERVPHIFGANQNAYIEWKHMLGALLEVDPRAMTIIGSAAVGSSLNPARKLKPFRAESDVDIAIVSRHHFEIVWRWLRSLGSERYKFPADAQWWINEHRERLLYWGVIATDRLLPLTPLAPGWVDALSEMSKVIPTVGRDIKVRIYTDFEALRAYHVSGVKDLQQRLVE